MSFFFYDDAADSSIFERAYALASSSLQRIQGDFRNTSLSELVNLLTKSLSSASNLAKPSPLASKATPALSQMKNISKEDVPQESGDVNENCIWPRAIR